MADFLKTHSKKLRCSHLNRTRQMLFPPKSHPSGAIQAAFLAGLTKNSYRQRLYIKFISPMLKAARSMPIDRTVIPRIELVINPKMCSIRHRILDFLLFFLRCSSVRGFAFVPLSWIMFITFSGSFSETAFPHHSCFCQGITKQPDGFCIRNSITEVQSKKPHETHTVIDLVLCLIIA